MTYGTTGFINDITESHADQLQTAMQGFKDILRQGSEKLVLVWEWRCRMRTIVLIKIAANKRAIHQEFPSGMPLIINGNNWCIKVRRQITR